VVSERAAQDDAAIVIRPREITLALERPTGTARNVFEGNDRGVASRAADGELVRVSLASRPPLIAEVTRQAVAALELAPGRRVFASFKAAGVHLVTESET
jgi:molybdopterin-binding protein